jgi:5-methylthioadenosine/S-adenosylhomocysteine deaminase
MLVDTLIHAGWIIPVEPAKVTYPNHSLVINAGRILDILPTEQALQRYQAITTENLATHALLPGLINCHTHAAMSLMRGIADDLPLMEWLTEHIWPLEKQWMNEKFVKEGTDLAIAEMLRGGTTCFNDMYFFPDIIATQAIHHGIRASVGLIVFDFATVWAENSANYIEKALSVFEDLRSQPLISTPFAPHAPYTVSDEPLQKIRTLADELELSIHTHLHETQDEIELAVQQTGKRPLQRLQELGLLSPSLIAAHAVWLNNEEIDLLADTGVNIVHCPESNLKLASGFCKVAKLLDAGINVALGTDGVASNNDLDMFGEMRTAALLGKAVANDASALDAMTVLRMATINGAKALGLSNEIGSLTIGKAADVIAVNLHSLETHPLYDPISQIVYAASRQMVTDVWVAGKHLLKQRELTTINVVELLEKVDEWQKRLQA